MAQQLPEGEPVDFEVVREDWNEYRLADGSTLKVKLVLTGVMRLKDGSDPAGNPVYAVSNQNAVRVVNVPSSLRHKQRGSTPTV